MMATGFLWQLQPEPLDTVSLSSILEALAHSRVVDLLLKSHMTHSTCTH